MKYQSKKKKSKKRAFTLAELIIVISIIGILVAGGTVGYNQLLKKARDSKRIATLEQYKTALEHYYQDHGKYPGCQRACDPSCPFDPGDINQRAPSSSIQPPYIYRNVSNAGVCLSSSTITGVKMYKSQEISVAGAPVEKGFLYILNKEGYIDLDGWQDPLRELYVPSKTHYDCRYFAETGSVASGKGIDACNVQRYFMHCLMEGDNDLAIKDGGYRDDVYEIYSGKPWVCIYHINP